MKFRHFEFRLFPKIRCKKKKKSKHGNPDQNFNYPGYSCHGFYDNLALDDNLTDVNNAVCRRELDGFAGKCANFSNYKTYPLPELKIHIDAALCNCGACADIHARDMQLVPYLNEQQLTPLGTPSTIPRTRTRIKTNPWVTSPKATPHLSPTETVSSIVFTRTDRINRTFQSSKTAVCDSTTPYLDCSQLLQKYQLEHENIRRECTAIHSLAAITDADDEAYNSSRKTSDAGNEVNNRASIEKVTVAIDVISEASDNSDDIFIERKRFSFTDFLDYDTDISNCSSPVRSKRVDYSHEECCHEHGFHDYEGTADELLDNSSFPRDETFKSFKELLDLSFDPRDKLESVEKYTQTKPDTLEKTGETYFKIKERYRYIDDDDEALDAGNITDVTNDDIKDENEVSVNLSSLSNVDLTYMDEGNMQESIDTGYASVTRETDSMSSVEDIRDDKSNVADLEWDNEPTAQSLLIDFPLDTNSLNGDFTPTSKLCRCLRPRSRSLADIELSLAEKVSLLREEKVYVQMKIRQAIEEEHIRRRQLELFRSVPVGNRKEVLLGTLYDLKTRLAKQSARLQSSYDTVLSLQSRFSLNRRSRVLMETNV